MRKSEKQLWTKGYDRDLRDVLMLDGDVAREIADEIRVNVTSQEQSQLGRARPVDPVAYDLYLLGFNSLWTHGWYEQGVKRSIEYFHQAIDRDPNLALAYVGVADAHILLVDNGFEDSISGYAKVEETTNKALELDPCLGEAHRALGAVKEYQRDWAGAQREFELAIKMIPDSARSHHWYAIRLANMGRQEDSIFEARRAMELDPLEKYYRVTLGEIYYTARRYENAATEVRKTIEVDPSILPAHAILARTLLEMGRGDEAIAEIGKAQAITVDKHLSDADLARIYALSGKKDEALKIAQKMRERSGSQFVAPTDFAEVYGSLGDKDEAFRWLETALAQRDTHLDALKVDPRRDPLRLDPRFQTLLTRVGL